MKDFLGEDLSIGDTVVMIRPGYRELVKAKIERFTKHYVFLKYIPHFSNIEDEIKQTPNQMIRIGD